MQKKLLINLEKKPTKRDLNKTKKIKSNPNCEWDLKIFLKNENEDINNIIYQIYLYPLRLIDNQIEYESFDHLIKNDKAFHIFKSNIQTDLNGRNITFGETIKGKFSLNCSRCYSTEGKRRQPYPKSFPIYVGVMLVFESQICSCHCVPVEPVLKKKMLKI